MAAFKQSISNVRPFQDKPDISTTGVSRQSKQRATIPNTTYTRTKGQAGSTH